MCAKQIEDLPLVGFVRLLFPISKRLGGNVHVVSTIPVQRAVPTPSTLISGSRLEPVGVLERGGVLFCRGASDD